jgi:integrase
MLRHTFATRCVEAKIAPAVLQKIMGHTDIATTMKYYVNVDDHFEISEYKNVESYLEQNDVFLLKEEIS